MSAFLDQKSEQFSSRRCAKNCRIVFFFKNARLVANDNTVTIHLLLHISVVTCAIDREKKRSVSKSVHLQFLVGSIQRQEITVGSRFCSLHFVLGTLVNQLHLDAVG